MKHLLSGNEAIARGAYEAGVKVCSAYPGTPSTEIFENLPQYRDSLYCEWAPNEKVAAEMAYGAAIAGVRSLCAMKHVGLNVAADPVFTAAYNGVNKGFVVVSADEPSMHSSQNEQDNRFYAKAARMALIEPSDSQECIDFLKEAYYISERFDMPVLFRTTTRISHSKSLVTFACVQVSTSSGYITMPQAVAKLQPRRVILTFGTNDLNPLGLLKGNRWNVGVAKPIEHGELVQHRGILYVTNQRIVFQASEKGFDKTYRYLTAVTPYVDACELQFGSKTYNMYVDDGNIG